MIIHQRRTLTVCSIPLHYLQEMTASFSSQIERLVNMCEHSSIWFFSWHIVTLHQGNCVQSQRLISLLLLEMCIIGLGFCLVLIFQRPHLHHKYQLLNLFLNMHVNLPKCEWQFFIFFLAFFLDLFLFVAFCEILLFIVSRPI